jgi:hypothetical protein
MLPKNSETIQTALTLGDYELKGQFMLGSNYTFLVNVQYEGVEYSAVYKHWRSAKSLRIY